MITFYFFGRAVEQMYGSRRLLTLYAAGILGGVLFSNIASGNTYLGASAAVNCILTYYICNFPTCIADLYS
jgi:membrane associated rhomboid family serine protease